MLDIMVEARHANVATRPVKPGAATRERIRVSWLGADLWQAVAASYCSGSIRVGLLAPGFQSSTVWL